MVIIINNKDKNYLNNGYDYFSPIQEKKLLSIGLPGQIVNTLDKSLWAVLAGDYISQHLTVFEAAELAVYADKYKEFPLISILKEALKFELGIKC